MKHGEAREALRAFQECLPLARACNRQAASAVLGNLGLAYDSLGQYDKAVEHFTRSLAIMEETGNRNGVANSLGGLGNAYDRLGQHEKAIDYHTRSLAIKEEIGDRQTEGSEAIDVIRVPVAEVEALFTNGEIAHALTIAAFHFYRQHLGHRLI